MSLSKFIQSPDLLKNIPGKSPSELKSIILQKGASWYNNNPDEVLLIKNNLSALGLPCNNKLLESIKENIILHYYEKLLPLCGDTEFYYQFLREHVDCTEALKQIQESTVNERGILLAISHFGAVEFITPGLAAFKLPLNTVLRFTSEQFSKIAAERAKRLEESGRFGPIRFIEIGKPGTSIALEMTAALRRKEILISVFDEKTEYSKPVTLFGKMVSGGAGLDRLLKFTNTPVDAYTAFMLRLENDRYRLVLNRIDLEQKNIVQQMFDNLQNTIGNYCEQWYFLHEEIPFIE